MLEGILTVSKTTLEIDIRRNPTSVREEPVDPSAFQSSVSIALWILFKKTEF